MVVKSWGFSRLRAVRAACRRGSSKAAGVGEIALLHLRHVCSDSARSGIGVAGSVAAFVGPGSGNGGRRSDGAPSWVRVLRCSRSRRLLPSGECMHGCAHLCVRDVTDTRRFSTSQPRDELFERGTLERPYISPHPRIVLGMRSATEHEDRVSDPRAPVSRGSITGAPVTVTSRVAGFPTPVVAVTGIPCRGGVPVSTPSAPRMLRRAGRRW